MDTHGGPTQLLPADVEDRILRTGPSGQVEIRIVRPRGEYGVLPVVMYFHGGGWAIGDRETHDRLVREIANGAQAAVVFVSYTRSSEAPFPIAIEEAYAATKWIAENARSANLDPTRIAVAGDGAGGNMATVVSLLAQERGRPRLVLQVLFYPVVEANFDTPSYRQFATGFFLTRQSMEWFWSLYAPEESLRMLPTASPLRATPHQLRSLPPALILTGECDVLRDEGEAYARKLAAAGVPVTAVRYLGMIHDFVMLEALSMAPAARAAISQANRMLREAFQ